MATFDPKRALVAAAPLYGLAVLLALFVVSSDRYVQCSRGNCASIPANVRRVIVADDSSTRIAELDDSDDVKRQKKIKDHQRVSLIFAGRINFVFLVVLYMSLCAFAFGVACYVIVKSAAKVTNKPWYWYWLLLNIAVALLAAVILYRHPQWYMSIFNELIPTTIQTDLPAVERLLIVANSFGFAVALLLTLASCAALYPRNKRSYPAGLKEIAAQMKHLRLVLYVGTAMLVVGVLLIRSIYQWSLAFALRDEAAIKVAESFFSVLLAVEGGYFTLVLAAVYLPAAFILRRRVDSLSGLPDSETEREKALQSYNLSFSFTQSLPRIGAILGPLLAGPVGELFSRLG